MVCVDAGVGDIDGAARTHVARKGQAVVVDVGDDDVPGSGVLRNRNRHDADWTCACYQHILADQIE